MNKLLPNISETTPITDKRKTFSDSPYNCEWINLLFKNKLQIVCDLVRQTMLYKDFPTLDDEKNLIGDSLTSAKISIKYLSENGIGENYRLAIAKKRFYENKNVKSNHIVLLVDDKDKNTYYYDATPNIGYGYGKVCLLNTQKYFEDIFEISAEDLILIEKIRSLNVKIRNRNISSEELVELYELLNYNNEKINGFVYQTKELLEIAPKISYVDNNIWLNTELELRKELKDLIDSNTDYIRQLEIIQTIQSEKIKNDYSKMKFMNIGNKIYPITYLTPRFFYEEGLTMVLIKPSSYKLGISASVKDKFLRRGNGALGEYITNMGNCSEDYGIKIMHIFHPCGNGYQRSMTGKNDIFLVKQNPRDVNILKKKIRREHGNIIKNTEVDWFDGKKIIWDPIITNLVHSTDDACETSMHYVSPFPEYQVMTRFMYPNPKLIKRKR